MRWRVIFRMLTFRKEPSSPATAQRLPAAPKREVEDPNLEVLEAGDPVEVERRWLTGLVSIAHMLIPQPLRPMCASFAAILVLNMINLLRASTSLHLISILTRLLSSVTFYHLLG